MVVAWTPKHSKSEVTSGRTRYEVVLTNADAVVEGLQMPTQARRLVGLITAASGANLPTSIAWWSMDPDAANTFACEIPVATNIASRPDPMTSPIKGGWVAAVAIPPIMGIKEEGGGAAFSVTVQVVIDVF